MRCLERNKKTFYYALLEDSREYIDENGNYTGQTENVYGEIKSAKGNISPASGTASAFQYGISERYDYVLVMSDPDFPLDVTSRVWLDCVPKALPDGDFSPKSNAIVVRKSKSLNSVSYRLRLVENG